MARGKVKWFNNAKGYGFIIEDGKDEDLFAHYSAIDMDGYKTLKAGQPVSFETIQGPKGLHAVKIKSVPQLDDAPAEPTTSQGKKVKVKKPAKELPDRSLRLA
ncbi:cold shock domain-containing protein CspD [Pseudomonas fluorescens]|uniref:Cold shock-like protein CspD n=1 Tax=Pseudomonas fluorescens TaxID=294 RepID=A0AAE2Q1S6_PSEFL|nr:MULTISPECIES: cold shock domain-containing protein CspD [Pseudomonas fluorescens group]MBA1429671.1 cold shock domain-containing protein CspD [Pseudomonas orientalis]MBD8148731.1 cold shock domain-containing protein CspD [Pseudomonas fluorescens]MBD8176216.1 cold shock domain-containing protein CspD [Pseudomonas fluorescens]MBD8272070.1 cold shock domain-containing protein CspD [Pseudomonas fluorescens]MBD8745075.1 cold shock domain-containing protein CspD [Pseudomonas fluorescens]